MKEFGPKVAVHIPKGKRRKLDPKIETGILVGYSEVKGYRVFFQKRKKIEIHRDIITKSKKATDLNLDKGNNQKSERIIMLDLNIDINGESTHELDREARPNEEIMNENLNLTPEGQEIIELESEFEQNSKEGHTESFESQNQEEQQRYISKNRKGRIIKPPAWMGECETSFFTEAEKLMTYEDALNGNSSEKWKEAVEKELQVFCTMASK